MRSARRWRSGNEVDAKVEAAAQRYLEALGRRPGSAEALRVQMAPIERLAALQRRLSAL